MWIQIALVLLQFGFEVFKLVTSKEAQDAQLLAKFVADETVRQAMFARAWENLRAAGKLDSLKAKSAWDKADQDDTPPTTTGGGHT